MKQTVEEAARQELALNHPIVVDMGGFKELLYNHTAMLSMFRKGTEWQAKQSPWISVDERLPIPVTKVIDVDGNEYGSINVLGAIQNSYGDYDYYICRYWGYNKEYRWENSIDPDYWMPIPHVISEKGD